MTIYLYARRGYVYPGGTSQEWQAYKRLSAGSWTTVTISGMYGFGDSSSSSAASYGQEFFFDQYNTMRGIVAPPSFASVPILQRVGNYGGTTWRQFFVDPSKEEIVVVREQAGQSGTTPTIATCIDITRPDRWVLSFPGYGWMFEIDMQEGVRKEPPNQTDVFSYYNTSLSAFSDTGLALTHYTTSLRGTYPRILAQMAQPFYFGGLLWAVSRTAELVLSDDSSNFANGVVQGSSCLIKSCVANPSLVNYDFSVFGTGGLAKIFWHEDSFPGDVDRRFYGGYWFTCPFLWQGHVVIPFRVSGHWYDTTSTAPYTDTTHESTNKDYVFLLDPDGGIHTMNAEVTWDSLSGAVDSWFSGAFMLDNGEVYRWHCEGDGYFLKNYPTNLPTTARLRLYHLTSYDLDTYSFTWTELDYLDIDYDAIYPASVLNAAMLMVTWDGTDILVRTGCDSSMVKTDVVNVFDTVGETWGTENLPQANWTLWWFKPLVDTLSVGTSYTRLIGK